MLDTGVVKDDLCVSEVVVLVDVEDKIEEGVFVLEGIVELVVRSVGLKCGLVYSLNFVNFIRLMMGSLKERLVNP